MFDINKCYDCFATEPNSAYFWSGLGENGQDIAAKVAQDNGGITLEMLMDKNKDELISAGFSYDEDLGGFYFSKENAQDWQSISQAYAEQASGDVHAVLGDNVRENSVWNTKELPSLEKSENVNRVISTDPSTGKDKDVLLDKSTESESYNISISNKINSQSVASEKGGGARAPNNNVRGNTDNPSKSKKVSTKRGSKENPPEAKKSSIKRGSKNNNSTALTQEGTQAIGQKTTGVTDPKATEEAAQTLTEDAAQKNAERAAEDAAKKAAEQQAEITSSTVKMSI